MASSSAAPSVLPGSTDKEKLDALCALPYKQQAVWFLNAYWSQFSDQAEQFWQYVEKYVEIDIENREAGSSVDELCAHRFLEAFKETLTVREMRTELRKSGAIGDRVKTIPLTHYLIFSRQVDWKRLVNSSQGDNAEEVAKAQQMLDAVSAAFEECKQKEQEARASEAAAHESEAAAKQAQAELEAALADLHAQEAAYNHKTEDLKKKSEEGGVVSRNRAKVQLDAHLAEDPLPLRRAKITTEAATKKAAKATAAAEKAREEAVQARLDAEQAVVEAQQAVQEAEAYLEEIKSRGGSGEGAIFWLERELEERKKYMPTSKGGIAK